MQAEAAERFRELGRADRSRRRAWPSASSEAVQRGAALRPGAALVSRRATSAAQFARQLVQLIDRLGDKYQVDELAAKYEFTGRTSMTIPQALEIKEELETIDRLLKQLEEAAKTAQIGVIDMESSAEFAEPGDIEQLNALGPADRGVPARAGRAAGPGTNGQRLPAHAQGLSAVPGPAAGADLQQPARPSRTGRHQGPIVGEGAVELQQTKPYEFGDSLANMDIPGSLINAMIRDGPGLARAAEARGHRDPPHAQHAQVRHGRAAGHERLDALRRPVHQREADGPGAGRADPPRVSRATSCSSSRCTRFAKPRHVQRDRHADAQAGDDLRPGRAAAGRHERPATSARCTIPPHFTNIQHGLQLARQFLAAQDTPNRQIILITDGLPTAHFEGKFLYLLYPPDPLTEEATMREGQLCQREGITINIFLLPSWSQSREDVQFAYRLAESTAAASSSPPARTSTATWSGTTSAGAARSWRSWPPVSSAARWARSAVRPHVVGLTNCTSALSVQTPLLASTRCQAQVALVQEPQLGGDALRIPDFAVGPNRRVFGQRAAIGMSLSQRPFSVQTAASKCSVSWSALTCTAGRPAIPT